MQEHIKVGREFPSVDLNTSYSFGLDDQEFVVAFETDNPADFLDLVQRLRTTESSSYTLRDTPTFTCISCSVERALGALDGAALTSPKRCSCYGRRRLDALADGRACRRSSAALSAACERPRRRSGAARADRRGRAPTRSASVAPAASTRPLRRAGALDRRPAAVDHGRRAIYDRLIDRFGGRPPTPQEVLADDPDELRAAAGLSPRQGRATCARWPSTCSTARWSSSTSTAARRRGDRRAGRGQGDRPWSAAHVPDVPPPAARRAAGRRPRDPPAVMVRYGLDELPDAGGDERDRRAVAPAPDAGVSCFCGAPWTRRRCERPARPGWRRRCSRSGRSTGWGSRRPRGSKSKAPAPRSALPSRTQPSTRDDRGQPVGPNAVHRSPERPARQVNRALGSVSLTRSTIASGPTHRPAAVPLATCDRDMGAQSINEQPPRRSACCCMSARSQSIVA